MTDVFISYKREERNRCEEIYRALSALRVEVWFDAHIDPGAAFDREIERAIQSARAVLVLWSRAAIESDWIRAEARQGKEQAKLVAARLDPCRLPLEFASVQTVDLFEAESLTEGDAWLRILRRVGRLVDRPGLEEFVRYQRGSNVQDWANWLVKYRDDPLAVNVQRTTSLLVQADDGITQSRPATLSKDESFQIDQDGVAEQNQRDDAIGRTRSSVDSSTSTNSVGRKLDEVLSLAHQFHLQQKNPIGPLETYRRQRRLRVRLMIITILLIFLIIVSYLFFRQFMGGGDPVAPTPDGTQSGNDPLERSARDSVSLFVLTSANVRDRPTDQGSRVLERLSRGREVQGRWVRGVGPSRRWLRVNTGRGVGYIWEGNLASELIPARNLGIATRGCVGESCLSDSPWFARDAVRLFADRFPWNNDAHDPGLVAPQNVRLKLLDYVLVTSVPGRGILTCDTDVRVHSPDSGSERLDHSAFAEGTIVETLYHVGEGYVVGRVPSSSNPIEPFDFYADCLREDTQPVVEEWVEVELPDGRSGWTNEARDFVCSSSDDEDPRCIEQ